MGKSNAGKHPALSVSLSGAMSGLNRKGMEEVGKTGPAVNKASSFTKEEADVVLLNYLDSQRKSEPAIDLTLQDCHLLIKMKGFVRWDYLPKLRVVDESERLIYEGLLINNEFSVPLSSTGVYLVSLSDTNQYFMKKIRI